MATADPITTAAIREWPPGAPHREAARAAWRSAKRAGEPEATNGAYDAGLAVMLENARLSPAGETLARGLVEKFGRCRIWIEGEVSS